MEPIRTKCERKNRKYANKCVECAKKNYIFTMTDIADYLVFGIMKLK